MAEPDLLFVDVQAFGSPGAGCILEVAWKNEDGAAHCFLVRRTEVDIPSRIQSITGISVDDLSSVKALPEEEVRNLFLSAAGLHPGQTPLALVAHYAVFEKKWLDHLTGLDLDFVCTRNMAREQLDSLRSGSLRAVAGYTGYSIGEKRRALEHVLATEAIYHALQRGFQCVLAGREERLSLPSSPGVYRFYDVADRLLYVGKAKNLRSRVNSHFTGKSFGSHAELISRVTRIEHQILESAFHAAVRESELISSQAPEYNSAGRIRTDELWFLSSDLMEIHKSNPGNSSFGPLVSMHPATEFVQLNRMLRSDEIPGVIVDNLLEKAPVDLVQSVVTEWKMEVVEQGILQYGKDLFVRWSQTDRKKKQEESEVVDEQYVRERLNSLLMAGALMCRKAVAIRLLEGCAVKWSEKGSDDIVHNYVDNSLSENWDQAKVRKLQVVLSEIKRVYKRSSCLEITTASGRILKDESLDNLLQFL